MYILDELSVGLYLKDIEWISCVLFNLKNKGNIVVFVEYNL